MKVGTREFIDLQKQFERDAKQWRFFGPVRFDKEVDAPPGRFYQDGLTNQLFHAYMIGYQYGVATGRDRMEVRS